MLALAPGRLKFKTTWMCQSTFSTVHFRASKFRVFMKWSIQTEMCYGCVNYLLHSEEFVRKNNVRWLVNIFFGLHGEMTVLWTF